MVKRLACLSDTRTKNVASEFRDGQRIIYLFERVNCNNNIYTLSMIGMFRAKLLHIPCYRLMFFNGFLDILDIIIGSITVTGTTYCTNPRLSLLVGHSVWSTWMAASVICMALATNRVVEMIPMMNKGKLLWSKPGNGSKNSTIHEAAFLFAPLNTDDPYEQLQTVHLLQHPLLSCLFVRYRTSSALGALWVAFLTLATQGLLRTLSTFRYATWKSITLLRCFFRFTIFYFQLFWSCSTQCCAFTFLK
ncbi:unnamed protein product [Heligmosomoides polygyrus]|uniref:G protein-coupled receptor n=1 Tax=Heligmosomoides polygyrus TaxID=6339 RepID=A0A183FRF3_HELPZ|nr:unnamed protein product [Heligmosomoides polygyrus]